jgi:hypothetical protein
MRPTALFAILATTALPMTQALAADMAPTDGCVGPCLEYSGTFDLKAVWLHPSDGSVGDSYLIGPASENTFVLKATDGLSFMANIITEPVIDAELGKNQIFSGSGTYVDVLQAQYDFENFSIWGGKIHPAFGRAWDVTPGLHGTDIAESYDLTERLGGGASFGFEAGGFANRLQASAFTVDRTILSESLFNNRGRTSMDDGGAGNSKGVSAVAVALDGCLSTDVDSCYDEGSFGYQLAARYQKGGVGSDGNELGFLGSLNKSISLSDETTLRLFGEAAWFRSFEGSADDAVVITASAAVEMGPATYSIAYSQQRNLVASGPNTNEYLVDATAMYDLSDMVSLFGESWSIGAGYTFDRADGENIHAVGLKLSSEFGANIPLGN